jgi:nucleoside-diphosphate-sugar epimerase
MTAFVTGAAGFLGRRVVARLLQDGHDVRCLVRSSSAAESMKSALGPAADRLEFVYASLQDLPARPNVMAGCDVIYHLAAGMNGSASTLFLDTVVGTRALLRAASANSIRRFVLVSSLAVYGTYHRPAHSELDETWDVDPQPHRRDPYTFSKVAQEQVCLEAASASGLPLVIVRPGVIYGPGRPTLLGRVGLSAGRFLLKLGGGDRVPCTYVDNCADAVVLAGVVPGIDGRAYNILDDHRPTRADVIRAYRRRGTRLTVLPVPTPLVHPASALFEWYWERSGRFLPPVFTRYRAALWKPMRYTNARAKRELGWQPKVSTLQALDLSFTASSAESAA